VNKKKIERIPIAEIRIVNPRLRTRGRFKQIVESIGAVGLKKPVMVSRRQIDADGTQYDLVYGQGRVEACRALGERMIYAEVTSASREEQLLMSLVENLSRRRPSSRDLFREIKNLKSRDYKPDQIATKLGLSLSYATALIQLMEQHAPNLVQAVEAGRIPISVALRIANGNDTDVQLAMSEAYEKGDLRGQKFRDAKRLVAQHIAIQRKAGILPKTRRKLTGEELVREYKHRTREQRNLVKKAIYTKEKLVLLTTAIRRLLEDEHFVTLLRAEKLSDMPEQLALKVR